MTLQECYKILGGNLNDVLYRMMNEKRIIKFLVYFINDKSYENLCRSFQNNDVKEAFRASHTLKGICMNLGFNKMNESVNLLTESLRNCSTTENSIELFNAVSKDYEFTISVIKNFCENME